MSMDALAALGDYDDDSEEEEEAVDTQDTGARTSAAASCSSSKLAPAMASALALPDADALLEGMPDWSAAAAVEEAPLRDKKGVSYNAVPMGETLQRETARAGMHSAAHRNNTARAPLFTSSRATDSASAHKKSASADPVVANSHAKQLLPPQLRRPNISTEDSAGMGVSKRQDRMRDRRETPWWTGILRGKEREIGSGAGEVIEGVGTKYMLEMRLFVPHAEWLSAC
eukprot:CAMPEP_0183359132 /NCGR_PEP_ID=MMETSP0164_2-20130417/51292_1 /TAXON_ID=221442 /ORGANISM="Coccolithus pelagicus ssp braarudi, Strain PLY182g" /LENGTH=227 /DNA_ID=CAMNT_0025533181 /DNA_START=18 /DNA_END=702 /DNA_ORIENTATION=-